MFKIECLPRTAEPTGCQGNDGGKEIELNQGTGRENRANAGVTRVKR